jgi:hypothetical protein
VEKGGFAAYFNPLQVAKNIFIVMREEKKFSFIRFCTCNGLNAKRLFPLESEIVKIQAKLKDDMKQNKQNEEDAKK